MEQGFLDGLNNAASGMLGGLSALFGQGGYIFAALVCFSLGFVLVSAWFKWQRRAVEVSGTVSGRRSHGKFYYPVYSYKFPDEDTLREATSDTGTTDVSSIETGREVKLMVLRDAPDTAHEKGGIPWHMLGFAGIAGGVYCFYRAFTAFPVTDNTWLLAVIIIIYFLNKSRRIFGSGKQRKTIAAYRQMQWNIMSEQPVDDLRASPEEARRMETAKQAQGIIGTAFAVVGACMLAYCLYLSSDVLTLRMDGITATGKVSELSKEYVSGKISGYRYFPVVRFQDKDSKEFTFKDSAGSSSPAYEEGDEVPVVYLAKDPQGTASIDHGLNDWMMPGLAALFGVLFLLKGLSMIPRRRDEVR